MGAIICGCNSTPTGNSENFLPTPPPLNKFCHLGKTDKRGGGAENVFITLPLCPP